MKWSHLARLLMAHKAPLLGLINQGKCLAVTHRAVLSRGSSLIAALSFMAGSLSILARVVRSPSKPTLYSSTGGACWWWALGSLIGDWEPARLGCRLGGMMMIMMMILPLCQRQVFVICVTLVACISLVRCDSIRGQRSQQTGIKKKE